MIFTAAKIFLARIFDVSIGTVRTIFTIENKKNLAASFAFIEVFIWYYVAREALSGKFTWIVPFAYSGGYAAGTYVGMLINDIFNSGNKMITVITSKRDMKLILERNSIKYSLVNLENSHDYLERKMYIVFINNKDTRKVINLIRKHDYSSVISTTSTNIVERKEL